MAGLIGTIAFSEAERSAHVKVLPDILKATARQADMVLKTHQDFFKKHHISRFYGTATECAEWTAEDWKLFLRGRGLAADLAGQIQPTSCVGFTMTALRQGFSACGYSDVWSRIETFTRANGSDGCAMQHGLQTLGWRILYWNPDTDLNRERDDAEVNKAEGFRGHHVERWSSVQTKSIYYTNTVDDAGSLVNFGVKVPRKFCKIPFSVGTAHAGYHVFAVLAGRVVEAHSGRAIIDPRVMEESPFNPLKNGGGPRGEYHSGLLAVPPGYGY